LEIVSLSTSTPSQSKITSWRRVCVIGLAWEQSRGHGRDIEHELGFGIE